MSHRPTRRRTIARRAGSVTRWRKRDGPDTDPLDHPVPVDIDATDQTPTPASALTPDEIEERMVIVLPERTNTDSDGMPRIIDRIANGEAELLLFTGMGTPVRLATKDIARGINGGLIGVIEWP